MRQARNVTAMLLLAVVASMALQAPVVVSAQDVDKVIVYAFPYQITEYSPFYQESYATALWISTLQNGLYARTAEADYNYEPMLAESMPVDYGNHTTFLVELKDGLKFSDGTDLTAYDVEYSYKLYLSSAVNQASYGFLSTFLNNQSVRALDDTQIVFNLTQQYAFVEGLFSASIVPKANYETRYNAEDYDYNDPAGADTVGAGPFVLDEIDLTNHVVKVNANPHFHIADSPKVDSIYFQYIETKETAISGLADGSIDILDGQYVPLLHDLDDVPNILEPIVGDPSHQEMSYNHVHNMFGNGNATPAGIAVPADGPEAAKHVRYAMSHMIPRDYIVTEIYEGMASPGTTVMPNVAVGYDATMEPRNYSVDTARTYMEMAGFEYTGDHAIDPVTDLPGTPFFSITILAPNTNPARVQWATLMSEELPKIGIGCTELILTGWDVIVPRTFGYPSDETYVPMYDDGGYDIFFVGYSWDLDFDPTGMYDIASIPTRDNFYNYEDPAYDVILNNYLTEPDLQTRLAHVSDWQDYCFEHEPVSCIIYPQTHWGISVLVTDYDALLLSVAAPEWHLMGKVAYVPPTTTDTETETDTATNTETGTVTDTATVTGGAVTVTESETGTPFSFIAVFAFIGAAAMILRRRR